MTEEYFLKNVIYYINIWYICFNSHFSQTSGAGDMPEVPRSPLPPPMPMMMIHVVF
jgi:hypothetical protein